MTEHDPRLYLIHVVESADFVAGYIEGKDGEAFAADQLLQDAVIRRIDIMGQNCNIAGSVYGPTGAPLVSQSTLTLFSYNGVDDDIATVSAPAGQYSASLAWTGMGDVEIDPGYNLLGLSSFPLDTCVDQNDNPRTIKVDLQVFPELDTTTWGTGY